MKKIILTAAILIASMTAMPVVAAATSTPDNKTEQVEKRAKKDIKKAETSVKKDVKKAESKVKKHHKKGSKKGNGQCAKAQYKKQGRSQSRGFNTPMSQFDGMNLTKQQKQQLRQAATEKERAIEKNISTIDVGQFAIDNAAAYNQAETNYLSQVQSILTPQQYQQYIGR